MYIFAFGLDNLADNVIPGNLFCVCGMGEIICREITEGEGGGNRGFRDLRIKGTWGEMVYDGRDGVDDLREDKIEHRDTRKSEEGNPDETVRGLTVPDVTDGEWLALWYGI